MLILPLGHRAGKGALSLKRCWRYYRLTSREKRSTGALSRLQRTGDTQNFDLAPQASRLVAAPESNAHERFNEAKIKAITGGNEIYCAHKHPPTSTIAHNSRYGSSSNQPVNADPDDGGSLGPARIEFA